VLLPQKFHPFQGGRGQRGQKTVSTGFTTAAPQTKQCSICATVLTLLTAGEGESRYTQWEANLLWWWNIFYMKTKNWLVSPAMVL